MVELSADTTGRVEALVADPFARFHAAVACNGEESHELVARKRDRAHKSTISIPPTWRRILIVEDHAPTLAGYRRALNGVAELVDIAPSIREALAKLQVCAYDVIIADLMLANGLADELIAEARKLDERWRRAPAYTILVSGLPADDVRRAAQEIQPDKWLLKPVSVDTLQDLCNEAFALRALSQRPSSR